MSGGDDLDKVLQIAKRYGVRVFLTEYFRELHRVGAQTRGLEIREPSKDASSGPRGHWCDPKRRTVWFDDLSFDNVETHLHEVVHVIMDPPGGIDSLSEDVVLMPFERILARQCFSREGYARVINWQETGTQIEWWDERRKKYYDALEHVPNYSRWFLWRQSHAALRDIGVVQNNRVTWQWPNWKKVSRDLLERGNLGG